MIRSITQQKPDEERERLLEGLGRVFIIGCGTCVTLTKTGGAPEVEEMKEKLISEGRLVTGHVVLPVACDNMSGDALNEYGQQIEQADVMLIMTCSIRLSSSRVALSMSLSRRVLRSSLMLDVGSSTGYSRAGSLRRHACRALFSPWRAIARAAIAACSSAGSTSSSE